MDFRQRQFFRASLTLLLAGSAALCTAQNSSTTAATFPPLEHWKTAVTTGNVAALRALYSTSPPARIATPAGETDASADIAFWTGFKLRRMKLDVIQSQSPQPDAQQVVFQAEIHPGVAGQPQTLYITEGQLWQKQGGDWRLVMTKRSDPAKLQQPLSTSKEIYVPGVDAHSEIKHALQLAATSHKRVLLVFGANWCYDCHVLDLAFHRPDVAPVLRQSFEVVHVDVGQGDKNQDIMRQYQVPMKRGIPAIAVLDASGKLLYSQQSGEFEKARALGPDDLLAFLNKWKPTAH
jgi:thioredoxin 1